METSSKLPKQLLLISASGRSLAANAAELGITPIVLDLFADWDTSDVAERHDGRASRLANFSDLLQTDWHAWLSERSALPGAAVVAGGAELVSNLVDSLQSVMPVIGTPASALAEFRDQLSVLKTVESNGVVIPRSLSNEQFARQRPVGSWLQKPKAGCGGFRVQAFEPVKQVAFENTSDFSNSYFQQKLTGDTFSALVVSGVDGNSVVLGVTYQLTGRNFQRARPQSTSDGGGTAAPIGIGSAPFGYAGSIGPLPFSWLTGQGGIALKIQLSRYAKAIAGRLGLVGVWGFDFIVEQQAPIVVDINPRITASAELYDSALKDSTAIRNTLELHIVAAGKPSFSSDTFPALEPKRLEAKAVLFNHGDDAIEFNQSQVEKLLVLRELSSSSLIMVGDPKEGTSSRLRISDIPNGDDIIPPGHPLLTLHVRVPNRFRGYGEAVRAVERLLTKKAADVSQLLDFV